MHGGRWVARPLLATLIRLFVLLVPALAGMLAAWVAAGMLGEPAGALETVGWWAVLVASAVAAVVVTQRLARRLLPLTWLLRLSLPFPDRAPSRLRIARRAARGRALRQAASEARSHGLGDEVGGAATRALVLVAALGAHDRRTRGHSERVRGLADVLAEEAGVSEDDRDRLRWAALLHDIGKLTVPESILNKPEQPDESEWQTLKRHPEEGDRLVAPLVAWLGPWAASVPHHHERWDGTGYPAGLEGENISLGGRILAITDAYEVMTAARPYKAPQRPDVARRELVAAAGSHFDPGLVRHFLAVSLGRLWWVIGGSAVLSLVPWLAGWWTTPSGAAARRSGSGPATAAAAVGALALAGVVAPAPTLESARTAPVEAAAPAPPAVPPPPSTAPPSTGTGPDLGAEPPASTITSAPPAPVDPIRDLRPLAPGVQPPPSAPAPEETPEPGGGTDPGAGPTGPESPAPPPPGPTPPPEPLFTARGQLLLPGLLGITQSELEGSCGAPSSQGVDAVVFELPPAARVAGAMVRVTGSDLLGLHNLDATFYSEECEVTGSLATAAASETGELPAGTRFVVVTDRLGIATSVELSVG